MAGEETRRLIEQYWDVMNENDWRGAGMLLDDDYMLHYPQSGERFRGRESVVAMNEAYPAAGRWRFTVHAVVADADSAVSDVSVTDGARDDRVVSFFSVRDGRIAAMTEYWPEPFAIPAWRAEMSKG